MFRLWVKKFHENRMIDDVTIVDCATDKSRTRKVLGALEEACHAFDVSQPIWLDSNVREFQRLARTRFYQDNFIESLDFEYLEIQVIEEDNHY